MSRPIAQGALCLSALLLLGLPAVAADSPAAKARRIRAVLEETTDLRDFQAPMTLKEALGLLQDKLNAKYKGEDVLPILVDDMAFRAEDENATDVYETQVKFPPFPRQMTVAAALRIALSKVTTKNATFVLRNGYIEVTTLKEASPKRLLRHRLFVNFEKRPLSAAVEELSALTGLSIIVDPRLGDKLKEPVTAAFNNDVSFETALRLLADMTGTKVFFTDDAAYLTSVANAQALHKEFKAEREERRAREEEEQRREGKKRGESVGESGKVKGK